MASTRFTVLTGHLSQYSLADLIGILRHQRKTGRLLIEYAGSPAVLFFKDGNLVDAQYNSLVGVQAIFVAFVQPAASFNFNPLMKPTRYSIDVEQQRVIFELMGCWTEDTIVVKSSRTSDDVTLHDIQPIELESAEPQRLISSSPLQHESALTGAVEVLALPPGPREKPSSTLRRRPLVLATATFGLLLVFGVPTLIAINNKARKIPPSTNNLQSKSATTEAPLSATTVQDSSAVNPIAATDVASGALDHKRERISNDQASKETRQDASLNPTANASTAAKESSSSEKKTSETAPVVDPKQAASSGQTVKVVMRIENGRVVQATVGDRRAGAEAYESLALRIARQRRYPAGVNKQETFVMKVDRPK